MGEKKKPREKRYRVWLIVLLIVLALIILLIGGISWYANSKLNQVNFDDGSREIDTSTVYEVNNDELVLNDLPDVPASAVEELPPDENVIVEDEDVMNILLLGTDERTAQFNDNARADSIMVLSLNTRLHTIKLISIERGIGVPVPGRNDDWITHTFRYGGAKLTMETVQEQFKLDVERFVRVNFHVFEDAIDVIGGVDINMTPAEANYLNNEATYVNETAGDIQTVTPGQNHLDGKTALCYARIRKIDSDWMRIKRQRTVVQAALNQVKNLSLSQLDDLADTILPMIQTNLTKSEIAALIFEIPGFLANGVQIEDMTIPAEGTAWNSVGVDGRKLIGVDFAENARILREFFYQDETPTPKK